jgi:2-phospho-L-lactate guanylyltransferase (CobY/MobA/RfbA family)
LARDLAAGVLKASSPRHIVVVSESEEVSRFAEESGVEVLQSSANGLNEAVQGAYGVLSSRFDVVIVAHGDLRVPDGLGTFEPETGITLFADHHGEGTNVLVVPTGLDFRFAYGPGSLSRHVAEAERLGVEFRVERDSPWRYDVDEISDLGDLDV